MDTDGTSLSEVLDAADTAFAVTDTRCRVRWSNRVMAELLALTPEQCVGRSLPALLVGAPEGPGEGEGADSVVVSLRTGTDQHRWLEVRCTRLNEGYLYRVSDVSRWRDSDVAPAERDEWQKALIRMADEDPLTGLLNRRALTRELERQLALGGDGALLLLDLDNFKDINDLRGHPAGDRVMCTLANVLRERIGNGHVLGRLGGDEFAVVLADTDEATAVRIADRLRNAVATIPVTGGVGTTRITVSAGVAGFGSGESWQAVLANADLALYASKDAGRNRVTVYEQGHYADTALRVTVLDRLRNALAHGGLELHAMPMVKLGSNRVVGHELLLRLEDGRQPRLGPGEFLPAAERSGLVLDIDRWVAGTAIDALVAHPYPGLRFNVNVSGRTLEDEDFGDYVLDRLAAAGVAPGRLGFEITETAAVTNLAAARSLAQQLRASGCRISLDDFGAGFGSFVHLKQLPITGVKIDGEFVRGIDYGSRDTVLVQGIVDIARGLGVSVVAEWVERASQVDALSRLGVRVAQGFHLGKPEPLTELLARSHGTWMRKPRLMPNADAAGEAMTLDAQNST
ncbi:putative bifunctional diguanylate cyclase/phosphodiesterase [Actinophytocola algeriensis]|uniref:Diguanylate cyclase (GGDEF)-like protein n=1 Tax=Actinophytocola algeriensis TaxID=1768010 RepID=A0A7W7VHQ2_9PSEU|nr:GGDEF domain-containing phosphodiesterase [Actinophytocola algeriensis]MBB4910752.1 diguanylate cyclase (GGDEF)-like protein [Actinophytocola algeriensis]MBE1473745.1 diguanylate cyclase (GGDEF)-like protein [Actinophytocola algeriensis]